MSGLTFYLLLLGTAAKLKPVGVNGVNHSTNFSLIREYESFFITIYAHTDYALEVVFEIIKQK